MERKKLSVTIITLNEEDNIRRCLESVKWADEIIVVDSGSTDRTLDICKSYNAKVIHQDWLGFGPQKQFAVDQTTHEWVLSLDADEWLSNELIQEIQQRLLNPKSYVYKIPRCNIFMGKPLYYGIGCKYVLRLFNKQFAQWNNKLVHENLDLKAKPSKLKNKMMHASCKSIHYFIEKNNSYTSIEALNKKRPTTTKIMFNLSLKPLRKFFKYYFLKQGFRDGRAGFIYIILMLFLQNLCDIKILEREKDFK